MVATGHVDHVLVASSEEADAIAAQIGRDRPTGVRLSVRPALSELLTGGATVVDVRGVPFVSLAPRRGPAGPAWVAKRAIDFVGAVVGLVLVMPVIAVVALAVKLDDRGPVFFRQPRVGRDGQLFKMWKFRTMVPDAEALKAELTDANEAEGPFFKIEFDPRVTRVGRLLRRLSLDELPQLINVLLGQMSLVGPRPFLQSEMAADPDMFTWRLNFLPGITGLWQIAGRSWLPTQEGIRMDLAYVENWSPMLDLRIILQTARVAVMGDRRPPTMRVDELPRLVPSSYLSLVVDDDLRPAPGRCDVSVVIVTHESAGDIVDCLRSVTELHHESTYEVIVVDNASSDETVELAGQQFPGVRVIRKRGRSGFSTNCNIGIAASHGDLVLLLNPDARLSAGSLDRARPSPRSQSHCGRGRAEARLRQRRGPALRARRFPNLRTTVVRRTPLRRLFPQVADSHLITEVALDGVEDVDWLLGAALMVRRGVLDSLLGFDEGYRLYCEDIDLCWRMHEAGWQVQHHSGVVMEHALGEYTSRHFFTRRTIWHLRSVLRFARLHGSGRPQPPAFATRWRQPESADVPLEAVAEPTADLAS